jgi:hypothetical protein
VIEARTGRKLFSTGRWAVESQALLVVMHPSDRTPVLVSQLQSRVDGTRVWFGILRIDLGGVQPLAAVPGIGRSCAPALAAEGGWLACQTTDDRVRVWRLVG